MTPPQAAPSRVSAGDRALPAASPRLQVLKKRSDFQRAARAMRIAMPGFILQMRRRPPGEADGTRVGYTCSKKVGNAVARNRAKRRLREAARAVLSLNGLGDADYVLIGRRDLTATLPYGELVADLQTAVQRLHARLK